jgi:hypothetical protein
MRIDAAVEETPQYLNKRFPRAMSVDPDERAWGLFETNTNTADSRGYRRFQVIEVNRNGRLARYIEDLGSALLFVAQPFVIPSMFEHTVAELRDIAERQRNRPEEWLDFQEQMAGESTLIADAIRWHEAQYKAAKNMTVSGPLLTVQRNGVPSQVRKVLR